MTDKTSSRDNGDKYITWKAFYGAIGALCSATILAGWIVFQAHAGNIHTGAASIEVAGGIQKDTAAIVNVLKVQYITQKTVLELKQASPGGLTPAEKVELNGIKEILETLSKRG